MDKLIATLVVILGAIYADPGTHDLWHNLVLPAVVIAGLAYLFWFRGFLIIAIGFSAFHFMDLSSESIFFGLLLPLLLGVCIISFSWWGVLTYDMDLSDFGGDCDGGDGGGGCDGGGGD